VFRFPVPLRFAARAVRRGLVAAWFWFWGDSALFGRWAVDCGWVAAWRRRRALAGHRRRLAAWLRAARAGADVPFAG
jgi:hypothetical protein